MELVKIVELLSRDNLLLVYWCIGKIEIWLFG